MENYEILKLADTLKGEMGVSCEVEIVTKSKGRIGKLLSEEKNTGVKMEKSILYIFKEKMTSEEKCIFLVSQQLCRKWIVPKSKKVHILLESIINKKYSNLFKEDKNFTKLLYNLISTGWILSYSVISKSLKLKYVNYLRKIYDPTKLEDVDNAKDRIEDLHELINFAHTYKNIRDLLRDITLRESFKGETVKGKAENTEHLILSTIHQAKGLEWKHVFLACCNDGILPFYRRNLSTLMRDSELRLFYVAISRAKDVLTISHHSFNGWKEIYPSEFLDIIG